MYLPAIRNEARRLVAAGATTVAVAAELGVSQAAVWRWANRTFASDSALPCPGAAPNELAGDAYTYLLGQYLGDGHLVATARVPVLRIYTCTDHPGVINEIRTAIGSVRGRQPGSVSTAHTNRMIILQSYWKHWPCLFPQHGPGRKHERPILLAPWQQAIVDEHPWPLIRGLVHSDGCRALNRVVVRGKAYEYPRYFIANESSDILTIATSALDRVGVSWRYNRPNSVSVARRGAVALMDEHVGPKA